MSGEIASANLFIPESGKKDSSCSERWYKEAREELGNKNNKNLTYKYITPELYQIQQFSFIA